MTEVFDKAIMNYAMHGGVVVADVVKYEETTFILYKPEWRLNENRKRLLWLQQFCFWLLRKMGCYTSIPEDHTVLQRVDYRPQSMLDHLIAGMESAEFGFNRKPTMALIGRRAYMELLRETDQESAAFHLEGVRQALPPYLGRYHWRHEIININLYEVPWLDGIVVL